MPSPRTSIRSRRGASIALLTALLAAGAALRPAPATASTTQVSVIEDDGALRANVAGTLATMRRLGVTLVKVGVYWSTIAPSANSFHAPRRFNATDPASYPAASWAYYDAVVRQAHADGLQVGFMVTGPAPVWAEGPGIPAGHAPSIGNWKPSPTAFGAFIQAVGRRYGGSYTPPRAGSPLPRVAWWSLWNEPNYGPNLAPQAIAHDTIEVGAVAYRAILQNAWRGLAASGHTPSSDTILIGETAPRGLEHPIGSFSGVKPLRFLRALYCVGPNYLPLRGLAATERSCPTTPAGSAAFRAQNPALFQASGFADHPYEQGVAPNLPTYGCGLKVCENLATHRSDPDYADFPEIPRLERTLDRLNAVYGSHTRFPIWNTEYGWWTRPPDPNPAAVPWATAAYYMNWAEYLSYTQPRLASYSQYLLVDPGTVYATGLELPGGRPKATLTAFELPLYLPVTTGHPSTSLLVWGELRPAPYALSDTGLTQQVQLQYQPAGTRSYTTLQTIKVTNLRGYFEVHQQFPRSGNVRLAWPRPGGRAVYSRTVAVAVK